MSPTRLIAALAVLIAACHAAAAQVPSAGSQLQQIPATPTEERTSPALHIDAAPAPARGSSDATRVVVKRLRLLDAQSFPESELIAASGFTPDSEFTLSTLRGIAASITEHYRSHGYVLAYAYLPPQDIVDGSVTIAVVEGHYGQIVVRNHSRLSDALAGQLLEGLTSGDSITLAPLESRLLHLSDLPGVAVQSTLVPGASVGASDLIVDVAPGERVTGSVDADNSGSRYTGAYRMGGTVKFNNTFGHGDVATLRALTSWDGLSYGRAAYQQQFGKIDAGLAYAALKYDLGGTFESLQAHGEAQIASIYGRYPLVRSRTSNLYAQVGVDAKTFRDKIDATTPATVNDKKALAAMLSLVADRRDGWGGAGWSTFSLTWTSGRLDLQSEEALAVDASTARTDGRYNKLALDITRLQRVTQTVSLYGAVRAQLATSNLDVSEKMTLAGASAVRAYPEGEAYVDQGVLVTLEARWQLPNAAQRMPGQTQLIGFLDSGSGRLDRNAWSTSSPRRTLSGAGLGVTWSSARSFAMQASYAHTLGGAAATAAPGSDSRFWINAVKYF